MREQQTLHYTMMDGGYYSSLVDVWDHVGTWGTTEDKCPHTEIDRNINKSMSTKASSMVRVWVIQGTTVSPCCEDVLEPGLPLIARVCGDGETTLRIASSASLEVRRIMPSRHASISSDNERVGLVGSP